MQEMMCQYRGFGDGLQRASTSTRRREYVVTFRFRLVPAEHWGRPDECEHSHDRRIEVTVTDFALRTHVLPDDATERDKVLYECALKELKAGGSEVRIDTEAGSFRASEAIFPPAGPFRVMMNTKWPRQGGV